MARRRIMRRFIAERREDRNPGGGLPGPGCPDRERGRAPPDAKRC